MTRTAAVIATVTPSPTATATVLPICDLYPIALNRQSLVGISVGTTINVFNGTRPGNFGWLTWTGDQGIPALVTSLTPPGNSYTYVNPERPSDHLLAVGDWVVGKTGVSNASGVRNALNILETIQIVVPVWDLTDGAGSNVLYHVWSFARIQIVSYQLTEHSQMSVTFLGYVLCPVPTATPTFTPTRTATATPNRDGNRHDRGTATATATPTELPRRRVPWAPSLDGSSNSILNRGASDPTSESSLARYSAEVPIFARRMIERWTL